MGYGMGKSLLKSRKPTFPQLVNRKGTLFLEDNAHIDRTLIPLKVCESMRKDEPSLSNQKPVIFISHINENRKLARLLKKLIDDVFEGAFQIFVSSDEDSIALGDEWLIVIDNHLVQSDVILLICSEFSIRRPWIGFEAGVGWAKRIKVIPLCCYGLNINQLPMPFSRWQGVNINRVQSFKKLLKTLAVKFNLNYDESRWSNELKGVIEEVKVTA